jgi:hemolysin III
MYYGERLNSISHLVGAVFALIALGSLLTISIQIGEPIVIIGFGTFGFSMVLLYTMSTLYHSFHPHKLKRIFKVLDHVSIYLLIAGTYTPFMLVSMRDVNGWLILGVVWVLALIGILSEIFLSGRAVKAGQIIIYLCMGWACTLDIGSLKAALPGMGFFWLLTGGIAYTVGIIFYIIDNMKWIDHAHGIWHFFVLFGSISHFISVIGFVR